MTSGTTASPVLFDPGGGVRYVIRKRLLNDEREAELADFVEHAGTAFWEAEAADGVLRRRRGIFKRLHERRRAQKG